MNKIDITADFTDPAFLAAVYEIIEKPMNEPIYKSDVETVDELEIEGRCIKSYFTIFIVYPDYVLYKVLKMEKNK